MADDGEEAMRDIAAADAATRATLERMEAKLDRLLLEIAAVARRLDAILARLPEAAVGPEDAARHGAGSRRDH